jgi:hypothetical protein
MMPYSRCWSSLQLTGHADFWHPTRTSPASEAIASNLAILAIDPVTGALVWQYGITGKPGPAPGELNTPDGFDLLLPDGSTPTHPVTG